MNSVMKICLCIMSVITMAANPFLIGMDGGGATGVRAGGPDRDEKTQAREIFTGIRTGSAGDISRIVRDILRRDDSPYSPALCVRLLAGTELSEDDGYTLLAAIARRRDITPDAVRDLVAQAPALINVMCVSGNPLYFAVRYGRIDVVFMLIDGGAAVDVRGGCNSTLLHAAVGRVCESRGDEAAMVPVVQRLIVRGCPLDVRATIFDCTPLEYARRNNLLQLVDCLEQAEREHADRARVAEERDRVAREAALSARACRAGRAVARALGALGRHVRSSSAAAAARVVERITGRRRTREERDRQQCPICFEAFDIAARGELAIPRNAIICQVCLNPIHRRCFDELLRTRGPACPLCAAPDLRVIPAPA